MAKGRLGFIAAVIWLLVAIDAQAVPAVRKDSPGEPKATKLYKDVYLQEKSDLLVFGNSKLTLEIGKTGGRWPSLFGGGIRMFTPELQDFNITALKSWLK
ncbi:hypothetical protein ES703_27240 [subsurface metagenome]